jgi:protocatechuate 3,4-dioxygenase, alpha subunit
VSIGLTPSQTIGPFFGHALPWPDGPHVAHTGNPDAFWVRGRVLDGEDVPVDDALVETWQAGPDGRFGGPFRGFGRCPTDPAGTYAVRTCNPGSIAGPDGLQAPHIDVAVFARGLLRHLITRIYFADEADANAADPVLSTVPAERRQTLIAQPIDDGYRFDIRLQGIDETVFFVC